MPLPDLSSSIDGYLAERGSPMAGQGVTFLRAGRKYGVDPRLLVGMAVIESSAGAKLARPYNPFNWGIHQGKQYGSWEESIMDVARGVRRGYIDKGLKTPQQIVSKYAPASDNNDEGNWAKVVGGVMAQLGGNPGPVAAASVPMAAASTVASPASAEPFLDPMILSRSIRDQFLQGKGKVDLTALPGTVQAAWQTPPALPVAPTPQGVPGQAAAPVPAGRGGTDPGVSTSGFRPSFKQALDALLADNPDLSVTSGWRSPEKQKALWANALRKYGSEQAANKWVARPGGSKHEHGIAADLGGNLAKLSAETLRRYGLWRPMRHEPWHVELIGSRG